jgi:DNA-binding NtrC family response regulator
MSRRSRGVLLVVDDESYVRESLAALLEDRGFRVRTAASVEQALEERRLHGVDAVLTDLKMPRADGLELVRSLAGTHPDLPVVVLTAYGTVRSAVECVRAGARDYLLKPTDPDELTLVLDRTLSESRRRRELDYLRSGAGSLPKRRQPLGVSAAWRRVLSLVEAAAPADTTVLLLGETGTGKEEVARLIHGQSARADSAFVAVNCAAVPETLFESEFFGHRRGAFTGAVADREGRFRIAHGGTLLLDEVDALPLSAQAKVLRVLEEGSFDRVGDSEPTFVDVRLVCASNSDLKAKVRDGTLRPDLYYRIHVFEIPLPPLRERREDIGLLAEAFVAEFAARLGKPVRGVAPETLRTLEAYAWPGNIRELRNVLERAVLLENGEELRPDSLPLDLEADLAASPPRTLREALVAEEKRLLVTALREAGGVRREAARRLGVDERNMAYYLRKHGLMGDGSG